jgi:hypothetical protein
VRIGFDDNRVLGNQETGGRAALPIFREVMLRVYRDELVGPVPEFPPAIEEGIEEYLARRAALQTGREEPPRPPPSTTSSSPRLPPPAGGGLQRSPAPLPLIRWGLPRPFARSEVCIVLAASVVTIVTSPPRASTGFATWSWTPPGAHVPIGPGACRVRVAAGVCPPQSGGKARTLRMSASPSSPGIAMSECTTFGRPVPMA